MAEMAQARTRRAKPRSLICSFFAEIRHLVQAQKVMDIYKYHYVTPW
jgi:hypothetical protein